MSRIEELEKQIQKLQQELEFEKNKSVIEYPFEESEEYWGLDIDGELIFDRWIGCKYDEDCFEVGNMFKTAQEAKKERDKRILLTRFRQFRDKCNGDWKPDWNNIHEGRYYIHLYPNKGECSIGQDVFQDSMPQFGRFKNVDDCLRAIDLFGKDIVDLWGTDL